MSVVSCSRIVCFSQDDGSGQGGLHQKNHPLAAEWPGFGQTKLSGSQLRSGLGPDLSADQESFKSFTINWINSAGVFEITR